MRAVLKLQQDHSRANISPRRIPVASAMHEARANDAICASPLSMAFFISTAIWEDNIVACPNVRNLA